MSLMQNMLQLTLTFGFTRDMNICLLGESSVFVWSVINFHTSWSSVFFMWGGLVYHLLETFSNFKCPAQIWLTRLVPIPLYLYCLLEFVHDVSLWGITPVLLPYGEVLPGLSAWRTTCCWCSTDHTHTHTRTRTRTHTQTYIKFLDTEGGTVCFMPVPEVVGGHQLTATVIDLSPWVEYEFRVLASNTIGTGEPSKPSKQARTKGTCMYCMSRKKSPFSSFKNVFHVFLVHPFARRMSLTSSFLQRNGSKGWVQAWRCIFLPRFSWEDWYYSHVC